MPRAMKPGLLRTPARYPWAMLLARQYESLPLTCPNCRADIRIVAFITDAVSVQLILRHIGEPAEPPSIAPARGTTRPGRSRTDA